MPQHEGQGPVGLLVLDQVQIGVADARAAHADEDLLAPRLRIGPLLEDERGVELAQDGCSHERNLGGGLQAGWSSISPRRAASRFASSSAQPRSTSSRSLRRLASDRASNAASSAFSSGVILLFLFAIVLSEQASYLLEPRADVSEYAHDSEHFLAVDDRRLLHGGTLTHRRGSRK